MRACYCKINRGGYMPNKSQYKHKLEYNNTYNRNNYRSFAMRFNINSEDHIIRWLEAQDSVKGYIQGLIEADMKKKKPAKKKKTTKKKG